MYHKTHHQLITILLISLLLPTIQSFQITGISTETTTIKDSNSKLADIIQQIDKPLIQGYLEDLVSFGPRMTGTYGCQKAGEYIVEQFESFGLVTSKQYWTSFGNRYNPRFFSGFNAIGILPSTKPESNLEIIFNAHYDSVKVSPGADDDGSGVAAILAAADVLSQYQFDHNIRFVCYSGEEQGLLGSQAYGDIIYDTITDKAIIDFNADGIGYATSETMNSFRLWGTEDASWLMDQIELLNEEYDIDFELQKRLLPEDTRGGSDYHSFVRYGIDAIAFFEGAWNPHWHSEDDTIEQMDLDYLTKTTKLITASVAWLADNPLTYPYVYIESPRKGRLYVEGRELKRLHDSLQWKIKTIVIDDIWIWANVVIDESLIEKVEFYVQDRLQFTDTDPPYKFHLNMISFLNKRVDVVAYGTDGQTSRDWLDVFFVNALRKE